jgi:MinD-like ATPase involved in chromosome partitioning or flagellar assembly
MRLSFSFLIQKKEEVNDVINKKRSLKDIFILGPKKYLDQIQGHRHVQNIFKRKFGCKKMIRKYIRTCFGDFYFSNNVF